MKGMNQGASRRVTGIGVLALLSLAGVAAMPSVGSEPVEGDWPRWRGPWDTGVARGEAPLEWSDSENVKWKAQIPGRGHSSPVIWGDKIFVTTATPTAVQGASQTAESLIEAAPAFDGLQRSRRRGRGRRGPGGGTAAGVEHRFELLCLDKGTGKTLWRKTATVAKPHEGYHRRYGSFASNSPITDGEHVFAFFGSRGIYAYDLDGNLSWSKDFGIKMQMRLGFGEGVAPVLHEDTLILNFDHEGPSFILALDRNSGEERWKVQRDEQSGWSPPLVVEHEGRKQVVVAATNKVRAYDFETGALIWECAGLGSNVIPAPVQHGDTVIVMSGHRSPNLLAIELGHEGDLTGTDAVKWTNTRGNSYTASPVLHDGKLYVLTDRGFISCFNATTGEPYYHQVRLPNPYQFKASPVAANGRLYLASESSDVIVLNMGEEYEVLAINTLEGQTFVASPAISDGEIFLRGENTLFCISEKG